MKNFILACFFVLTGCGGHKDKTGGTVKTVLDGDWLDAKIRVNADGSTCNTKLVVGEGKGVIAEVCSNGPQIYHIVAYGPIKVEGSSYEIKVETACPVVSNVTYPAAKGSFRFERDGTNLIVSDHQFNKVLQEYSAGSATAGCMSEGDYSVVQKYEWDHISSFIYRVLAPVDHINGK